MTARFHPPKAMLAVLGPFDRIVGVTALVLAVVLVLLLWRTNSVELRVVKYSWQGQQIGTQDRVLSFHLNQPLVSEQSASVFKIEPPLAGQLSGQGRHWFYTLSELPRYGTSYQVTLEASSAQAKIPQLSSLVTLLNTHNRALVYIGISPEEQGRLILLDITNPQKPQKLILTPKDLRVREFQIYPQGDRILFTAYDPNQRRPSLQVFTVTTGIHYQTQDASVLPGKIERILEDDNYDNFSLALARHGKMLVWQRTNRDNIADSSLWAWPLGESPRPLGLRSDDFILSADGQWLALAQEGGVSLFPLVQGLGDTQFLAGYSHPLAFLNAKNEVLLSQLQADNRYRLMLLPFTANSKAAPAPPHIVVQAKYPVLDCQFEPRQSNILYCLKQDFVQRDNGQPQEEPFLAIVNQQTQSLRPLLALPNYPDVSMSVAPDGLALLFDQVATVAPSRNSDLLTPSGQAITDGRIWLLALPDNISTGLPNEILPQELAVGFAPQWMP
ncbi:hypothetical protein [Synechocystis sp. LKSZ1]|uniref:hypothetical protein n=1 Tax=Synechocystis sp. LKSZ1 TaxID=3144951 RepID=UPI00336BBDAD